jgi:hypothetical protein
MTYERYHQGFQSFRILSAAGTRVFLPGVQPSLSAPVTGVFRPRRAVLDQVIVELRDNLAADLIEFYDEVEFNTAAVPSAPVLLLRPWQVASAGSFTLEVHREFSRGLVVRCNTMVTAVVNVIFGSMGGSSYEEAVRP